MRGESNAVVVTFDLLDSVVLDDLRFAHDLHGVDLLAVQRTHLYHVAECTACNDTDDLERRRQ